MKKYFTPAMLILVVFTFAFTSCVSSGKLATKQTRPDNTAFEIKLKKSITDSLLTMKDDGGSVMMSVKGSMLFAPGSAQVDAKAARALKPLGALLYRADENFTIMIHGDTATEELTPVRFVDDFALSQARANTVMRILTQEAMQLAQKAQKESAKKSKLTNDNNNSDSSDSQQAEPEKDSKKYVLVLVNSL